MLARCHIRRRPLQQAGKQSLDQGQLPHSVFRQRLRPPPSMREAGTLFPLSLGKCVVMSILKQVALALLVSALLAPQPQAVVTITENDGVIQNVLDSNTFFKRG